MAIASGSVISDLRSSLRPESNYWGITFSIRNEIALQEANMAISPLSTPIDRKDVRVMELVPNPAPRVAEETKPPRNAVYIRIAISLCALALLVLHRLSPKLLPTDTLGMGLLLIIALPWVIGAIPLSEVDLLGVKLRLKEVTDKQAQDGETLTAHAQIISDLVTYSMSASIFRHLCGIGLLKEYKLSGNDVNRREFYFLRDNGFIGPKDGGFVELANGSEPNLSESVEPTPIGWLCIKLRRDEVPRDWLSAGERGNLVVDPYSL